MIRLSRLLRRLRLLIFHSHVEQVMDDEIRQHLDEEIADRIAHGMTPDTARRSALIDFGGIEQIKEQARDARGGRSFQDLAMDIRYAGRMLRRSPVFTIVAVLTFALGAGAGSAIFSVVYGVLLRPLPYSDSQQLVVLWERDTRRNQDQNVVSAEDFQAWRDRTHSFSGMAALAPTSATIASGGDVERVPGAEVSAGYFTLLGVHPAIGRDLTEDDTLGQSSVVLSDGLWRRRFGGDLAIIGRSILIGDHAMTVVGVMPAGFAPPQFGWLGEQQMWFPMKITSANYAWGRYLLVVARLKTGTTIEVARTEMATLASELAKESPSDVAWSATAVPLATQISGDVRPALIALLIGVSLLLVMAMTNVALLTLSAMQRRQRELAVRRALGATDGRLFRLLFAQSALVGVLGATAGFLLALPATKLLVALLPLETPRLDAIRMDRPVLIVMTGVTMMATLIFGATSAWRGKRATKQSLVGRETGDGRTTSRGGGAFVSAEIALGLAVSVMAVLMVRSLVSLRNVDLGFDFDHVIAARVAAPPGKYSSPDSQRVFYRRLIEQLSATPGVESAGVISGRPLGGIGPATRVRSASVPEDPAAPPIVADVRYADSNFCRVLRIAILKGRMFDDSAGGPPQVVISESLARVVWPDGQAVGRRLAIDMYNGITPEVIAVIHDVHLMGARTRPRPLAILSTSQFPDTERDLLVRASGSPESVVPALRAAVAAIEPGLPLYRVSSMSQLADRSLASDRFTTFLLSAFAFVALILAGIGIFGVFSTDVSMRRKEIGLRLALGGSASAVMTLLLQRTLRRAAIGVFIGLSLAYGLTGAMTTLLFGISAHDPLSMFTVTVGVLALTITASLIPAAKALRASPLSVLREE